MHNVFISYYHRFDQTYKKKLIEFGKDFSVFIDKSVDTGDIPEYWSDEAIRKKIRDEYLRNSTVTILLVGTETKKRKHIDWELYSSMFDGTVNKKSGILVINLPSLPQSSYRAAYGREEKHLIYPGIHGWDNVNSRTELERRHPYLPARIIDNLVAPNVNISVVPWERLTANNLKFLIDATFDGRSKCEFDLSRPMMRKNV